MPKPRTREELEKQAAKIIRKTANFVDRWRASLDGALYSQINQFFAVKLQGVKGALQLKELPIIVSRGKLAQSIAKTSIGYEMKLDAVKDKFSPFGVVSTLSAETKTIIAQSITTDLLSVQNELNLFINSAQKAALSNIMYGTPFNFDEFYKIKSDPFLNRVSSSVLNSLNNFEQSVSVKVGTELGLTWYYYAGGLIKTSRPFCVARAGKAFPISEIKTWDNGQGLPVLGSAPGGYNCLHTLQPTTEAGAKEING